VFGKAEHDALDAQGDARGLVGLGLLTQGHEILERSLVAVGESRGVHGLGPLLIVVLLLRVCYPNKNAPFKRI
jgi:hypothetical protein